MFFSKTLCFCTGVFEGPQALFAAEQAAAGTSILFPRRTFVEKDVFGSTPAMFTAEQVAAGLFLFKTCLLKKGSVCQYLSFGVNMS